MVIVLLRLRILPLFLLPLLMLIFVIVIIVIIIGICISAREAQSRLPLAKHNIKAEKCQSRLENTAEQIV